MLSSSGGGLMKDQICSDLDDTMAWWLVGKKEGLGREGNVVGAERVVMKYR